MKPEEPSLEDLMGDEVPVEEMQTVASLDEDVAEIAEEPVGSKKKRRPRVPTLEEAVAEIQEADAEDRLHPILSNEEVLAARAEAAAQILADRKKAAKKKIIEEEKRRLQIEDGMVTGDGTKDQMVRITLDLAPHSPYIALNHQPYYHGHTYTVARHVAEALREIQQSGWRHQDEIEGKSLKQHYQRARFTGLSAVAGVTNAPKPVADAA